MLAIKFYGQIYRGFNYESRFYFIYSPELLKYKFSDHHPFNQLRLKLTLDLLMKSNAIKTNDIVPPRFATKEELSLLP